MGPARSEGQRAPGCGGRVRQGDMQKQWVPEAAEAELPGRRCGAGSVCELHGQPGLSLGSTRTRGSRGLISGETPTQSLPPWGRSPERLLYHSGSNRA